MLADDSVLAYVFFFLLLLFCSFVVKSRSASLSHIPGPWLARYTDIWAVYFAWRGNQTLGGGGNRRSLSQLKALQATYGDVIRTGPRTVIVLDPAAVPIIYGVRSKLDKGDAYVPFRQPGVTTSLLSIADEKTHSKYRKLVSNAYSMSSLKGYEPYMDQMVHRFCEVCDDHAQNGQPLNLTMWCYYYCYDIVSKVTLGSPLGFMDGEGQDAYGLIERVKAFGRYVSLVSHMPWLHTVITNNPVMRKVKPSPFFQVVQEKVANRMRHPDPDGSHPDLLSHFVATHATYPDLMDTKQVTISASGNLIAGGLSPGATFDALCRFLVKYPEAQERLFGELRKAETDKSAQFDDVKHLPYLEGVIREAERLHQGTAFTFQRVTGPEGLNLPTGVHLPPGTKVGCPSLAINRDVRIFGPDASEYRPERWSRRKDEDVDAFEARRKLIDRTDLSFGQGSRTCIGKNIFRLEIFKVLAALLVRFKFTLAEGSQHSDVIVKVSRRNIESKS